MSSLISAMLAIALNPIAILCAWYASTKEHQTRNTIIILIVFTFLEFVLVRNMR